MEYSSRLTGVDPATAPHASILPIKDDWNIPMSVQRDLSVARTTRANLLLIGTERRIIKLVRFVVPDLHQAIVVRCQNGRLLLPSGSLRAGTVVIRDVDVLTPDEQRRLCEWLDSRSERTQVVSTASAPLVPLVESRAFSDALYYRLNMVYVDLTA